MKSLFKLSTIVLFLFTIVSCDEMNFQPSKGGEATFKEPSCDSYSNGSNFNYQNAGMLHNDFLGCVISEVNTWSPGNNFDNHMQLTAAIFTLSENCSGYTYAGDMFSFGDIFYVQYIEEQRDVILNSDAFSKAGKYYIATLINYYLSDQTPLDAESQEFISNLIAEFERTSFSNSTEKEVVGSMLYLAQGSVSFWSEHDYMQSGEIIGEPTAALIPAPVLADIGGMAVSVGMDALDGELANDKIDDHIISGVVASAGAASKVGQLLKKWFF